MSLISLILSNLKHYRKAYLAILAGTIISTAVLTGALVVGDSVRYSLVQLTEVRLGKTRFAIEAGDRFFRQQLASELSHHTQSAVAPVLQLDGIAVNSDKNAQLNKVDVAGIDARFMNLWDTRIKPPAEDEAIVSSNTAEKLHLKPGNEFILKIRKQSKAPENAPFVSEKESFIAFRLKVTAIADERQMGRFSLKSNQSAPFNVFISLPAMSRRLEMRGNANLLLIAGTESKNLDIPTIDSLVRLSWQPEDAGLEFRKLPGNGNFEIRSARIFIDDTIAKAVKSGIPGVKAVFTYLVNDISTQKQSTPYSFVTAIDTFSGNYTLSGREMIISDWLANDLSAKPGDSLTLKYFKMGTLRKLTEDSTRVCIKKVLPVTDPLFDKTLMPEFPGMSDAGSCSDWETGAPVNLDKIRDKDEQYWKDYRGTPKAFISISLARRIWDNAFGHATSFRFKTDSSALNTIKITLLQYLNPAENGLAVREVFAEGQRAAENSTDFGELFLSLSFFIIAAALLLIALLFSLLAQNRLSETAVLATLGFRKNLILRVLFFEVTLVVVAGSAVGVVAGIFYNKLMLSGLNTIWQGAVNTSLLQVYLKPVTLITGFGAGVLLALLVLLFQIGSNLRKPLAELVKGVEIQSPRGDRSRKIISYMFAALFFVLAVSFIAYSIVSEQSDVAIPFLTAGGLILIAGITLLYGLLVHQSVNKITTTVPGFFSLVFRNVNLKRRRTLAAVALLAMGTFSVIITGANRKTFYGAENTRESGTGGFLFWAESTIPVQYDLNSAEGKRKYGFADETELSDVKFLHMLRLDGNDASCLNLNQVSQPAILGVNPAYFDLNQSFSFLKLDPAAEEQHPWLVLNTPLGTGIIPGFADQTVIQWGLRKKVGDTLLYKDEQGAVLKIKLMGGLDNSIFQGNILVSEKLFARHFPSAGGSRVMLIDGEFAKRNQIAERLSYLFQDYGMALTSASGRLAQFNSVENTYLSVFMLLSGLGIIIGTAGLGIVLLRNLADRKKEMALYQAIGFTRRYIIRIILIENLLILLAGIGIGTLSAFAGILPSFLSPAFQLPATYLLIILLLITANGIAWIFFPTHSALRGNQVKALRKE